MSALQQRSKPSFVSPNRVVVRRCGDVDVVRLPDGTYAAATTRYDHLEVIRLFGSALYVCPPSSALPTPPAPDKSTAPGSKG